MDWFAATGIWGWLIAGVALTLVATSIACAFIRIGRGAAVGLVAASCAPMLLGVAGMVSGRAQTDKTGASTENAPAGMRREGYDEAQCSLWFGLGSMMVCDVAAVVALLRSRPPGA